MLHCCKDKIDKECENVCYRFFFSAVFLNNKHVPNGNKTLEHLEKFYFSYCDNRPKSEIFIMEYHYCNSMKQKQTEKVNGMY